MKGKELSYRLGAPMPIYVVIAAAPREVDKCVTEAFAAQDRCPAGTGVWFVRSQRVTSSEVAEDLGIELDAQHGLVVAAANTAGVADRVLIDTIVAWERDE